MEKSGASGARRKWLITGMVVGGILALTPLWGIVGTVIGMMLAFDSLAKGGVAQPDELADSIGVAMLSTALGIALCPIGLALLVVCVILFLGDRRKLPPPLPR